ncbi:ATP-binding protein [Desulfococcaceae bacterium HSG7]|nr:ATP-binding protein [Desulfococcaceae bacterium HSG7]
MNRKIVELKNYKKQNEQKINQAVDYITKPFRFSKIEFCRRSNKDGNFHEITVSDTGVGISDENIAKLFRIDGHFSTYGTEKESGTGLGLILCKEFVEKNDGRLWVTSEDGQGSNFSFTVPCFEQSET